ncbi:MAG: aminotransferase class I/II-fold pyridoxal phosphate-dependent enzyme [Candidatus Symbiothrix sp.]|jgi:dTDP-4-amino-4,6-dideoxygalactose transaminase|nr:aminotransferase class I/II-fold pyridoxal phosphate-dependent enzyme [Candidatus Symbiothrix sp.]
MKNSRIYLSLAHIGGREQEFIQQAFDTNWVVPMGPNVSGFEQDLVQFLGNDAQVSALSSGTAALHLGLILLDVKPDDEVLCQSFTFAASANPIVYLGAKPVFVDSERDTWNLSPEHLERAIQDRIAKGKTPKAIIVVHAYGMPAKMDEIRTIANRHKIPLLEDAASALGSTYKGIHCGTLGELAALSFNGNKIITTSGGGALVATHQRIACKIVGQCPQRNDGNLIKKARFLATQARDAAPHYQHSQIGYNYRMSNIVAGIGRGQMLVLPERIAQRRANNQFYRKHLAGIEGITFQTEPNSDFYSNYWLTSILIDPEKTNGITRETLRLALEAANIESRPLWKPMHLQPIFADCPFYGDGTGEDLFNKGLCLPSGSILTEQDLQRVVKVIKQILV